MYVFCKLNMSALGDLEALAAVWWRQPVSLGAFLCTAGCVHGLWGHYRSYSGSYHNVK